MTIKDVMTPQVAGVVPEDTLWQAAHKMRSLKLDMLPVCDGSRIIGVVTRSDIVLRAIAKGADPKRVTVANVMTRRVYCCFAQEEIGRVARRMVARRIHHIVVVNARKDILGIASLFDIALRANACLAGELMAQIGIASMKRWQRRR